MFAHRTHHIVFGWVSGVVHFSNLKGGCLSDLINASKPPVVTALLTWARGCLKSCSIGDSHKKKWALLRNRCLWWAMTCLGFRPTVHEIDKPWPLEWNKDTALCCHPSHEALYRRHVLFSACCAQVGRPDALSTIQSMEVSLWYQCLNP